MTGSEPYPTAEPLDDPLKPFDAVSSEARYRAWLRAWLSAKRELPAARLLVGQCAEDLGWLAGVQAEPLATAVLDAYEAYPELAVDYPVQRLADAIAAAPSHGAEQALSNLFVARRIDPTPDRTLAILIAGRDLIEPSIYEREIARWLESRPPQAHVTRLMRSLADDGPTFDALNVIGQLAAYGTSRPGLSTSVVARFGNRLTLGSDEAEGDLPSGVALVRARQAVRAATIEAIDVTHDITATHLRTVDRLRSHLRNAGYDAARPPRAPRGRVIENPSWVGEWGGFVSRQGGGLLRSDYFETDIAERDPGSGGLRATSAAPYLLARSPTLELPTGHFCLTFIGGAETNAHVRCEARGFTGARDHHSMAVSTRSVSRTQSDSELGVLEFVLVERAADVVFSVEVLKADGPVTLTGMDIRRIDD